LTYSFKNQRDGDWPTARPYSRFAASMKQTGRRSYGPRAARNRRERRWPAVAGAV